jgi:hypothetical protein
MQQLTYAYYRSGAGYSVCKCFILLEDMSLHLLIQWFGKFLVGSPGIISTSSLPFTGRRWCYVQFGAFHQTELCRQCEGIMHFLRPAHGVMSHVITIEPSDGF